LNQGPRINGGQKTVKKRKEKNQRKVKTPARKTLHVTLKVEIIVDRIPCLEEVHGSARSDP
jgi:hypothetical protein